MKKFILLILLVFIIFSYACKEKNNEEKLFTKVSSSHSQITFNNKIEAFESDSLNALEFDPLFNGGGIGVGDFNNDGLSDLFFAGNMVSPKFYINKGNLKFEDVTEISGLIINKWCTGVSVTDINNDGLADLYISVAGKDTNSAKRTNLLYINQGNDKNKNPHFKEMAKEYGLNDSGYNVQSAFFDYDHDGDLDCYILKNAYEKTGRNNIRQKKINGEGPSTDRLYQNTGNKNGHPFFKNVSALAGIIKEGYGLGLCISDINQDGWDDIYCANDFLSNDLVWVNNHDGTFTDKAPEYFKHTSYNSMGVDIQDYNNDSLPDICVVDMLPEPAERRKMMLIKTNWDYFNLARKTGYQDQYVRNVLQLNQGKNAAGKLIFSEIGQLAGIHATDWSWSPLLADFDNDGYKDLMVSNGYRRDITNLDYVIYLNQEAANYGNTLLPEVRKKMIEGLYKLPEVKINNYIFRSKGDLTFENKSESWGLDEKSYSNGAVYADLDNDGDLDLVYNNIDDEAGLFKNNLNNKTGEEKNNFIRLKLKAANNEANGAKVKIELTDGQILYQQNFPVRGYMSSVEPVLHFGLGKNKVLKIEITWANGRKEIVNGKINSLNSFVYNPSSHFISPNIKNLPTPLFDQIDGKSTGIDYTHEETNFDEFKRTSLLPHVFNKNSPGIAIGDADGNGLDDIFIGTDPGFVRKLYLQKSAGKFSQQILGENDMEDMGSVFLDADNDGDQDLYVVSGGSMIDGESGSYQDRLYINDGKGKLTRGQNLLPKITSSGGVAIAADFDKDGDLDIFRGGRVSAGNYPLAPESFLLLNNGIGEYKNVTDLFSRTLKKIGMVTSALWTDVDNDGWIDLMLAGECMPVIVFKNNNGKSFIELKTGIENDNGWWNSLAAGDFDNDGDMDYIAGNLGLNTKYKASKQEPVSLYAGDFDKNNRTDPIITYYIMGKEEVAPIRDVINDHMSSWARKKFISYSAYSKAGINEMLSEQDKKNALILKMTQLQSCYIENIGNGKLKLKPLPIEAQFSTIFGISVRDYNGDGMLDVVAVGNSYAFETYSGWFDASPGIFLTGDGKGNFKPQHSSSSGIYADKDAKALAEINMGNENMLIVTNNNSAADFFKQKNYNQHYIKIKPDDAWAIIEFKNGKKQKMEFTYGSGYLSMSSRGLMVNKEVIAISIFDFKGYKRALKNF